MAEHNYVAPVAYSRPLWANTVLCSFNTMQPSSLQNVLKHWTVVNNSNLLKVSMHENMKTPASS